MVKADEKATDANRAIHIAAVNGHTVGCYSGVVQALIEFDKKMSNAANNFGTTPLHLAVYAGKTATAAFLLKHGASPNACDRAKVTPIHNAVARGSHDLFWLLIAYGARCDILDKEGETLTDWARCFKRREMEEPIACALAQARKQAAAAFSV
ncbi:ankyrin repeat-containing protein [Acanthamoeba castellanii str. Neff]|uniref:Ankyrin repeat-containing protein n=1 Tax=Acanthamoeba castellanii (strain ATCC 30010 / Neff) TaxID=1257118 RepID=L8HA16_ACACF|nr:ankyrin repeat-containing protein [Acanthamoeba castellanii str. Neff]ELR21553.1 ankyrin repeat-containing protein [Acanthamoeba castellanii str. Neff]